MLTNFITCQKWLGKKGESSAILAYYRESLSRKINSFKSRKIGNKRGLRRKGRNKIVLRECRFSTQRIGQDFLKSFDVIFSYLCNDLLNSNKTFLLFSLLFTTSEHFTNISAPISSFFI